jgi:hypothetical protein
MSPCLTGRSLWHLASDDEPAAADQAHVLACPGCASRYDALVRDLSLIRETLQAPPPEAPPRVRLAGAGLRRLSLAAGVAALVLVVGLQAWRERPAPPRPGPPPAEESLALLDEVSAVLWSTGSAGGIALGLVPAIELAEAARPQEPEWFDRDEEPALGLSTGAEPVRSAQ